MLDMFMTYDKKVWSKSESEEGKNQLLQDFRYSEAIVFEFNIPPLANGGWISCDTTWLP
jgi:hypothetical protein